MISIARLKLIKSLDQKKFRNLHKLFVVEGNKIVREVLHQNPQSIHSLYATQAWLSSYQDNKPGDLEIHEVKQDEMKRISFQRTPQEVMAVLHLREKELTEKEILDNFSLVLDNIQDPGNVGTIIRIADWFGIMNIICSTDTADLYNPKTIQASMGSFLRVKIFYRNLGTFLSGYTAAEDFTVYASVLEGDNLFTTDLDKKGLLILGNESKGVAPGLSPYINQKLMIPSFGHSTRPDSLNVAAATAVFCAELRR